MFITLFCKYIVCFLPCVVHFVVFEGIFCVYTVPVALYMSVHVLLSMSFFVFVNMKENMYICGKKNLLCIVSFLPFYFNFHYWGITSTCPQYASRGLQLQVEGQREEKLSITTTNSPSLDSNHCQIQNIFEIREQLMFLSLLDHVQFETYQRYITALSSLTQSHRTLICPIENRI